ncbi:MAG: TolC family protein [Bacteroidales bacterium]|jgi:outer membrane protein TolC|nr:TolC family protein [Bacteroidales bacterium]
MKSITLSIIIILLISFSNGLSGQEIKLIALIDSALANKGNIQAVRTDIEIAKLQTSSAYQKYLPDLSLSYNYRYNPVIPTQIIPVGQFNPVPTDEKRPIKFGTDWQQNSGLNLYQPIIDFSIKSRVAESRINEKLKNIDAAAAERDLKLEVIKSFTNIWLREEQHLSAALDTLRTSRTKELFIVKSKEGKVLKTEVNRAILNHNNALSNYVAASSSLTREKIYMGFLTGIYLEILLDGTFDFSPFSDDVLKKSNKDPVLDSIPSVKSLRLRAELFEQQQKSERMKYRPTIGFEGFLGANQYTDTFNPFLSGSWYGSSYMGLSLRFQILSGSSTRNKVSQLKLEEKGLKSKLEDEMNSVGNKSLLLTEEIRQIEYQAGLSKQNIALYEENLSLNQDRFDKGQINAYDLLTDEIDFQKEQSKFNEKRVELVYKQIELINNSGALSLFIENLR